jgi:hypothetical protein
MKEILFDIKYKRINDEIVSVKREIKKRKRRRCIKIII